MGRSALFVQDVYSVREIARAAGVSAGEADALMVSGLIATRERGLAVTDEAVRAVLILRGIQAGPGEERSLFNPLPPAKRKPGLSLTASGLLHVALGAALVVTIGLTGQATVTPQPTPQTRLVFLVRPGPGGGGGGGGLKQPAPPRPAQLAGKSALKSPVPIERAVRRPVPDPPRPPRPVPEIKPVEQPLPPPPPVAKPDPPPPVVAPVESASAEPRDQAGVLAPTPQTASQGDGVGGGAGRGKGTGIGEGSGPGIGEGSGGGTGGGPYRPGSGITPPSIVREVKPDYTEDARRRALTGDVVLEIVVKSDGRVGAIRLVQGLGAGLDERAIDAVRQWKFSPAMRHGTPVDVLVEVAVEFRLR